MCGAVTKSILVLLELQQIISDLRCNGRTRM